MSTAHARKASGDFPEGLVTISESGLYDLIFRIRIEVVSDANPTSTAS
jgi:prophage antirepressor-like protein